MQLLAAARIEELRARAAALALEMERHQVPVEYLANRELATGMQTAHNAKTSSALTATNAAVQERMFLIGKDGIMRKRVEWTVEAIVSGSDELNVRGRLVDTDIVKGEERSQAVLDALIAAGDIRTMGMGREVAKALLDLLDRLRGDVRR